MASHECPVDPLEREPLVAFDMATEYIPYQRLAAAVILHAVTDRRDTLRHTPARERIDDFLFGRNPGSKTLREHWFRQAGLPSPTKAMVLALVRRLEDQKNSEYRVIQKEPKR